MKTTFYNHNLDKMENLDDKKISISLMAPFVILTIQYFILIYFNLLGTADASRIQLSSKVLVAILFLYALPAVWKRSKIVLLGCYYIGLFIFLFHYWIFPENSSHIQGLIFPFFFMCLPAFIYSASLYDWNIMKQVMKKASFIVFIFGAALGILIFAGKASAGSYSMSLSYYLLLPTIVYLDDFFDKPSIKALLFVLVPLLVILALGSRGAILCIGIFILLKAIRFNFRRNYTMLSIYTAFWGTLAIMFLYLDSILEYIYNLLLIFGIRSRSIQLFLREEIHLSGRDHIYQNVIEEIVNNPLLGIGLGGDRQVVGGGYVHNLFLELLANFGIIFGMIIIITLVFFILKVFLIKDKEKYNMFIIWISLGFVHLMVSSSYLTDLKFWILIGFIIGHLFIRNRGIQSIENPLKQ